MSLTSIIGRPLPAGKAVDILTRFRQTGFPPLVEFTPGLAIKGGTMRALSGLSLVRTAVVVAGVVGTLGCSQWGMIQANRSFKAANQAYTAQDYEQAAALYEEAVAEYPDLIQAYFFLANSYDNLYRPSRAGDPENDSLLTKAEQNYKTAADRLLADESEENQNLGKLSLDYLRALYVDKLQNPGGAEEAVQRLIRLEPGETTYYFALARIYEDAGVYDEAEYILQAAQKARPEDPNVYVTLAGFYNRMGDFDKTIAALQERAAREPDNPEASFTIATYYWDNAQRNALLSNDEKMENVQKGLEAVDKALKIRPDYVEAIVYRGLLLRVQALLERDPARQQALIKEAEALSDQAEDLRKKRAAGV